MNIDRTVDNAESLSAADWYSKAAVIALDVVGTVVEPSEPIATTYSRIAAELGRPHDPALVTERFAAAMKAIWSGEQTETDEELERERWRRTVAWALPESGDRAEAIFETLWEYFASAQAWTWHPDALRLISRLQHRGVVWGVASNFDRRLHRWAATQPVLSEADFIWTSAELGALKRNPEFYVRLRERIERNSPACRGSLSEQGMWLMIGDQPVNDVTPSKAAGWQAIWLRRPLAPAADPPLEPVSIIGSFDELV